MDKTLALMQQLQSDRFYGAVTVKFEAGKITHIRLERNIKPDDLSETPRNQIEFHN